MEFSSIYRSVRKNQAFNVALQNGMEAGGIEPPSRDNVNGGLYMLIRCFNLEADDEHRNPSPASRRLNLISQPTSELGNQPVKWQPANDGRFAGLRLP